MRLLKLTCITITFVLALITMMCSCHPKTLLYRSTNKYLALNDSITINLGEGGLNYSGRYYYYIQLDIMNKSNSSLYIDTKLGTMESVYENKITLYMNTSISDSIIYPHSEKRIFVAFKGEDSLITSDYFKDRKRLKDKHHFSVNLNFLVGDSVLIKNVKYTPK